jgi:hypothetical protein
MKLTRASVRAAVAAVALVAIGFVGGWYGHVIYSTPRKPAAPTSPAADRCASLGVSAEDVRQEYEDLGRNALGPDRVKMRIVVNNPECFDAETVAMAQEVLAYPD